MVVCSVMLLVVRPMVYMHKSAENNSSDVPVVQKSESGITKDMLVSVAVDNRYYYLAKKISDTTYGLCFVDPYHQLKRCQSVYTTGIDKLCDADIKLGVITQVGYNTDDLYATILVEDAECVT